MRDRLEATEVTIRDVLGARRVAFEPGKVTVIRGANGTGKTSIIRALQAAIGGGSLAKLARIPDEGGQAIEPEVIEPEVVLVLKGQEGSEFLVERKAKSVKVRERVGDSAAFEDVPRPQAFLSGEADTRGWNPVAFLSAPDKDRALMLLEALPLEFSRADLEEAMGLKVGKDCPAVPSKGLHALEELSLIREAIFNTRTGVNRDLDGKKKAADQTRRNAPAVVDEADLERIQSLEDTIATMTADLAGRRKAANSRRELLDANATAEHDVEAEKVSAAYTEKVRGLRAEMQKRTAEIRAKADAECAELERCFEVERGEAKETSALDLRALDAALSEKRKAAVTERDQIGDILEAGHRAMEGHKHELATLKVKAEGATKAKALHEQAEQFDREAEALEDVSTRLTVGLEALDAFRRELGKDLPIDGLEISGPKVSVHGVPLDQLNTAQQLDLGVQVAILRAKGRLPMVWVDRAETLDPGHFDALVSALERAEVQSFVCRVTEGPLEIVADGRPAVAEIEE